MKALVEFNRHRNPQWKRPSWYVLPFIEIVWHSDYFLETGVYTKALTVSFGWLKWAWTWTIQEGY